MKKSEEDWWFDELRAAAKRAVQAPGSSIVTVSSLLDAALEEAAKLCDGMDYQHSPAECARRIRALKLAPPDRLAHSGPRMT